MLGQCRAYDPEEGAKAHASARWPPAAWPCRALHDGSGRAPRCRAIGPSSRVAWHMDPTRNGVVRDGYSVLPSAQARRRRGRTVNQITLLAESTRRVGTAWPGAGCKAESDCCKAARKIRDAAAHNRLISFGSASWNRDLNGSPRDADDSSRRVELKVEFVNHPKAVFSHAKRAAGNTRVKRGAGELLLRIGIGNALLRACRFWSGIT